MHIIDVLLHKPKKIYYRLHQNKIQKYKSIINRKAPVIFISYISDVFYYINDDKRLYLHQNKREALSMIPILNKIGYSVYVQQFDSELPLPNKIPTIIFGMGPVFFKACNKWPNAKRIYYGTGSYYKFQNSQIIIQTDLFNKEYNCKIPYRRLILNDSACELADLILQIGSKYTLETYPKHLQEKITLIHQSTLPTILPNPNYSKENEFLFMAANANILRGLHMLFDVFSQNDNIVLNIVGNIEEDFYSTIKHKHTPNIKVHGLLDLKSEKFKQVSSACNFIIYPSGSEGLPGSILCTMKIGIIPIVTRWAADDNIKKLGYLMNEWNLKSVIEGINWALSLSLNKITELKKKNIDYINTHYSLSIFRKEFESYFLNIHQNIDNSNE